MFAFENKTACHRNVTTCVAAGLRCGTLCPHVVLRCTRQLLMRLKYPNEDPSEASTTRLGDWSGTLIRFGRRHVLLFISERSRLPVVLPVRDADRLMSAFPAAVSEMLAAVGVPTVAIDHGRSLMSPLRSNTKPKSDRLAE